MNTLDEYIPGEDDQPIEEYRQAKAVIYIEAIDRLIARWGSGLEHLEDLRNDLILEYQISWHGLSTPVNISPVARHYGW
tara:strand:+ start:685 stop:921 length:237 start_codon:yes stop_codon:yes gene_type:complete